MENYILWSVSATGDPSELSFFATSVHVQRINRGTKEMIVEMLADLGIANFAFEKWSIHPFFTNYMADEQESEDWEDIWAETWEITVPLALPVTVDIGRTDLIRTYARDKSWRGDFEPTLPGECVVVSDFYSEESIVRALEILGALK